MSRWAFKCYPAIKWAPALIGSLYLLWITCNRITSFELHDETSDKAESAAEYTEVLYIKTTLIMVTENKVQYWLWVKIVKFAQCFHWFLVLLPVKRAKEQVHLKIRSEYVQYTTYFRTNCSSREDLLTVKLSSNVYVVFYASSRHQARDEVEQRLVLFLSLSCFSTPLVT